MSVDHASGQDTPTAKLAAEIAIDQPTLVRAVRRSSARICSTQDCWRPSLAPTGPWSATSTTRSGSSSPGRVMRSRRTCSRACSTGWASPTLTWRWSAWPTRGPMSEELPAQGKERPARRRAKWKGRCWAACVRPPAR